MIYELETIQCNANVQDTMHNGQRTADRKDGYAFFKAVKRSGGHHLDWVHKPRVDTSSSSIIVSGHNRLVNADRLTSSCAKGRARACEMNQPTLPKRAHRQLMRSPRGS